MGGGGGIEDNSKIFFLFLSENICLDVTVLMMGHKICFCGEIWLIIPKLSLLSLLIWSTVNVLLPLRIGKNEAKLQP